MLAFGVLLGGFDVDAAHSRTSEEATQPTASAASKRKKKRVYCTKRRRPKGCVKVPRSAMRPSRVDPQGPGALTPNDVENGGGLGGGPGDHRDAAVTWALEQLGSKLWRWRCERLVEEAYGTRGQFDSAAHAAKAIRLNRGSIGSAPRGALVYFGADRYNRGWGHVGLSLGGGKVISALDSVRVTDVSRSRYWRSLYLGWADAPEAWPGRIPPPPNVIADFDANASVRITAPAPGGEVSGIDVPLMASASGVTGVVFDAFFATNPREANSRQWQTLGKAALENGSWTLHVDTTKIPDQGHPDWGTVNIAAIALDARGRRTGVRDFRRLSIKNASIRPEPTPTPSPDPGQPPPPPPTYKETTGGYANTWSDYRTAGGTQGQGIPGQTTVEVRCRIEGYRVPDGNTWWYRLAQTPWNDQFYATADAFYNNGQTSGSLQGTPFVDTNVPIC